MYKNHVDLIGFIGSDPEARQLENGTQRTSLSLATKTSWKNEASTYDSRTEMAPDRYLGQAGSICLDSFEGRSH